MDDLESDNESVDAPPVSPFIDSDDELDDGEVLNELNVYGNAGNLYNNMIINDKNGCDLAFLCMIGFTKIVAYFDPFLPMNVITLLEDVGEYIEQGLSNMVVGMPFRGVTRIEYDCVKGLISFTRIFDTYIFRMPRTIPRLRNLS
ncbi:hypothetical protein Tco_0349803 [Tanacetum coccineum]